MASIKRRRKIKMNGKRQFAQELKSTVAQILEIKNTCNKLVNAYTANGYIANGYNVIDDSDVQSENVNAADLEAGIELAKQIVNLIGNEEVIQADYMSIITRLLY